MLANAETGTLQPQFARIAHAHGALFHTNAAEAADQIPIDVTELGVDLPTVVGHKIYARQGHWRALPQTRTIMRPTTYGGGLEHGLHAGTRHCYNNRPLARPHRQTHQSWRAFGTSDGRPLRRVAARARYFSVSWARWKL